MTQKPISPYDIYETDKNMETGAGVALEYPFGTIIIHRAGGSNKRFAAVLSAKIKPHRRKHEQGLVDDDLAEKILVETYAETVIVGWKGIYDKNGKELPFTIQNCIDLLINLPDLFKDIQEQANNFATFKDAQEGLEEKN